MSGKSSLLSLDPRVLDACHEALRAGKTVDQITEALQGMGADVSRSSIGRYLKTAREQLAQFRLENQIAEIVSTKYGEHGGADIAIAARELGKVAAFKLMSRLNADLDEEIKPDEALGLMDANRKALQRMTRSVANLSMTERVNIEVRAQIEQQARQRALEEVAAAVKRVGSKQLISAETMALVEAELKLL